MGQKQGYKKRLSAVPTTLCSELSKMRKDFFKKKNRPLVPKLDRGSNNVGYYIVMLTLQSIALTSLVTWYVLG